MNAVFIVIYVVSVLITGAGALYLLRDELEADRRRIKQGYGLEVTWLKIVGGTIGVFVPVFNTMVACAIICALLDRPVITKRY